MNYKCNSGFISKSGRMFSYGEQIDSYTYNALPRDEQGYFIRIYDESPSYTSTGTSYDSPSPSIDYGSSNYDNSSSSSISYDSSSDSSSGDFGGYGGGESGGAGSGGDF